MTKWNDAQQMVLDSLEENTNEKQRFLLKG